MWRRLFLFAALLAYAIPASAQDRCRQALALGLDVSGSVDSREYRMQLDGLAAALQHEDVRAALFALPDAPVFLTVYEWSSPADQTVLLPWVAITDTDALKRVVNRLKQTQRQPSEQSTGLGTAMLFGANLLKSLSNCWTRTLDISGDGKSNTGPEPKLLEDSAFPNMTINALVIGADSLDHGDDRQAQIGELTSYFDAYVIRGPGRFVEVALGFEDYERAMVQKLKREISGMALSQMDLRNQ